MTDVADVIVMGAGVVGVTSAWALASRGLSVTVVERAPGPAAETSRANGCALTPGHSAPWNAPSAPLMLLRSLFQTDPMVTLSGAAWSLDFLRWGGHFLAACRASTHKRAARTALELALHSRDLTDNLVAELDLAAACARREGILYLNYDAAHRAQEQTRLREAAGWGLDMEILSPDACLAEEPLVAPTMARLQGGILARDDRGLDCGAFTHALARAAAERHGVTFRYGETLRSLRIEGGRLKALVTDLDELEAENFILALGPESGRWAAEAGFYLPIAPAKGYTLTLSSLESRGRAGPRRPFYDDQNWGLVTPLADGIRIACYGHFAGFDRTFHLDDFRRHRLIAKKFLLAEGREAEIDHWACLRAMSPDGLPVIDRAPGCANLWLNCGHCYLGWTWGLACADLLASRLLAEPSPFEDAPLRYRW